MAVSISGKATHTYVVESIKRGKVTLRLPDGTKRTVRAGESLEISHTFNLEKS